MPHSLTVWKTRKEAEDYCLTWEEHKRWMRNHPEVAGRKKDSAKVRQCMHDNAAKINGTRDEFRAAYDSCMKQGYGLLDFQPETK